MDQGRKSLKMTWAIDKSKALYDEDIDINKMVNGTMDEIENGFFSPPHGRLMIAKDGDQAAGIGYQTKNVSATNQSHWRFSPCFIPSVANHLKDLIFHLKIFITMEGEPTNLKGWKSEK